MQFIETDRAPIPGGHYTQATVHNGLVFISGQLPIHPVKGKLTSAGIEEQTQQALDNVQAIAEAAGSNKDLILKLTVYISDISFWPSVNTVCAHFFGAHKPARAIVPTGPLHYGLLIEIEAVAAVKE